MLCQGTAGRICPFPVFERQALDAVKVALAKQLTVPVA